MAIVGRANQYASLNASGEFNEIGVSKVGVGTTGTFNSYEFNENILAIVTSGLVLNLDAGNASSYPGSGTIWKDVSGDGNNGTLTNGPTYSSANGGSIVFDGTNDYVIATRPSSIVTGGSISVSVWAKWITTGTTIGEIQVLVDNNHSSSPIQGFVLQDRPDLSKSIQFGTQFDSNGAVSTFQVGDGTWHHIVGTNDTVTSKLYIDGILNNSAPQGGLATVQPNISIGYWQFTPGRYLNGNIAQASIYNRALSASEVLQNYDALKGRFGNFPTTPLTLNSYSPYDLVSDEFGGTLYGPGKGTYVTQKSDQSIIVYNEINELDLTPTIVFTPSATSLNEGGIINFSIATTNVEDGVPLYYEIITPSPTVTLLPQSVSFIKSGKSISFDATTVNVGNGTTLSYDIVGTVLSSDFTDNTLTGITTVTAGIIDTITKTTTSGALVEKTFTLNLRNQGIIVATSSAIVIKPGLYDFTTATFTPGAAIAKDGPTLAQAISGLTGAEVNSWKNNTAYFNTTNGIQLWTVPVTGIYTIEAFGAQGGSSGTRIGGKGTRMSGNFNLTQGEIVRILVGQQGQTGAHSQSGSQFVSAGGGGTFVVRTPYNTTGSILVIAGGGGGSADNSWTVADGRPALITNDGNNGGQGTGAGTGGNGGTATTDGGPGAGFLGNGATPSGTLAGEASQAFINGGKGGRNARSWGGVEIYGGFGGGGGGGGLAAGGGGGYSGGGAGQWSSSQQGGGGGSYNSGTSQSNQQDSRTGDGQVTITLVG